MGKVKDLQIQEANRIMERAREKQAILEAECVEMERRMFQEAINRLAGHPAPPIQAKR